MAVWVIRRASELGQSVVLAPERYDPRRSTLVDDVAGLPDTTLRDLVLVVRDIVSPRTPAHAQCIVLDTSDAHEGIVTARRSPTSTLEIGSQKKRMQPGDVIISRLRPYLRQVAYVDDCIRSWAPGIWLLGSTEFFVLRPTSEKSIAFLVPYLLSSPVQQVLAASQEGGHHPRFDERTLLNLPVPESWLKRRDDVSREVIESISHHRLAESILSDLISDAWASTAGSATNAAIEADELA